MADLERHWRVAGELADICDALLIPPVEEQLDARRAPHAPTAWGQAAGLPIGSSRRVIDAP